MASVYASLLSLIKLINLTQNPPSPYAYLNKLQTQPLLNQASFFLELVEYFSHHTIRSKIILDEIETLERRITVVSNMAEAIIDLFVLSQIQRKGKSVESSIYEMTGSSQNLEKVVQELDLIKEEMLKIQVDYKEKNRHSIELAFSSLSVKAKAPPPSGGKKNSMMIGFDDDLLKLKEKLTTDQRGRLVLPIVGMGGTELGGKLYQALFGRRYLIVLDDLWSITVWDELNRFLPDNGNRSRILLTTRLSNLAYLLRSSLDSYHEMKFLDDDVSWSLLLDKVFDGGKQVCPPELEEIGRIIAKKCSGLPLAIVVMGGLLKMSDKTLEQWNEVVEKVSSTINNENDEQCLRILSTSYDQLPIQLKPLFIYMAIFPEDHEVKVSRLIKLWIAEGFIKPPPSPEVSYTTLEEIARSFLNDLVDRNLFMVHKRSCRGHIKICKIHDLLRDLSLREVKKERFLCTEICDTKEGVFCHRRFFSFHSNRIIFDNTFSFDRMVMETSEIRPLSNISELLRVFLVNGSDGLNLHDLFLKLSNSRYISFSAKWATSDEELNLLPWNLETLLIDDYSVDVIYLPFVIWEMHHLRHLKFDGRIQLSMPNSDTGHDCVLHNLQSLSNIVNFKFTDEIICRIPNLKKLGIVYDDKFIDKEEEEKLLQFNLNLLQKLEILSYDYAISHEYRLKIRLNFPPTLKKLSLCRSKIPWENMNIVGSLPKLQELRLVYNAFCGSKWIATDQGEDQFQCLKSLKISISDLEIWEADSSNFPVLEHLEVGYCRNLEEIPWGIGEIPSLQLIELIQCKRSANISARNIYMEVEEQGINDDLRVHVGIENEDAELQSLTSLNFKVIIKPLSDYFSKGLTELESSMGDSFQPTIIEQRLHKFQLA